ncbi:ATP-dependent DNA helicase [Methanoplanus endosymbiosus]|uniref:ATP-dependent DNA helicase Hel308 n=1 Tax=Methanoplanus endosymbiosus TaxID=33865 RepID=A0A9E7PM00_9EURY|nr:ATP-dependent DNA helicase [Methanoplanus endosymbiosus]UUX91301.1 ATP-dependent DNA helicase [Methanoplanus endosymbiosus]
MRISSLPIGAALAEAYEKRGITDLYPPQEECVSSGLFEGANLLISIPTASGKTLVAEMAMHHHISGNGKCLYVVPLRALASEKFDEFSERGAKIGIATGDLDRRDDYLGRNEIIIATSEKVDSLLRNGAGWLKSVSCLILDEAHLIDSPDRGATLEMVITKLRYLNPEMQIIALTATIGNPKIFAGWLNATLVKSEWRPVDLKEGIFYRNSIFFGEELKAITPVTKHEDVNLCLDCIKDGGQCLVFVNSRRNAESFAKRMAQALKPEKSELPDLKKKLEEAADTEMGKTLAVCAGYGAAFHHAGMKREQRAIIEKNFRNGNIKVISSTPTLAAGLNLPARRVVIRDYLRFKAGEGMQAIPVREYRQMAGRAGRPHLDPYGEAVLIAKSEEVGAGLYEEFIEAPAEDVKSRLDDNYILTGQVLSLIATGFVKNKEELAEFLDRTFYRYLNRSMKHLEETLDEIIDFLVSSGMITVIDDCLSATRYGSLVSRLYINPYSADIITTELKYSDRTEAEITDDLTITELKHTKDSEEIKSFTDIGLLQMLCVTPDMYTLFVRKSDIPMLEIFLYEHEDELWSGVSYDSMEEDFRVLKTAMMLNDWISEVNEETVCKRYNIGPGDIHNSVESINWLLYSASGIAAMMAPLHKKHLYDLSLRMKHGIKKELLPLVKFRNIGRVRARRLYNNNIRTVTDLKKAGYDKVSLVIGQKNAKSIFDEIIRSEGDDGNVNRTHDDEIFNKNLKEKKVSQNKAGVKNNRKSEVQEASSGILQAGNNSVKVDDDSGKEEKKAGKKVKKKGSTQSSLFSF